MVLTISTILSVTGLLALDLELELELELELVLELELELELALAPELDPVDLVSDSRTASLILNSFDCGIGEINHLKNINATAKVATNRIVEISIIVYTS